MNEEIYKILKDYDWPGNIRELENITERLIALSPNDYLNISVLEPLLTNKTNHDNLQNQFSDFNGFDYYIQKKEKEIINWALTKSDFNVSNAAKLLKIPRTTLRSKMEKLSMLQNEEKE